MLFRIGPVIGRKTPQVQAVEKTLNGTTKPELAATSMLAMRNATPTFTQNVVNAVAAVLPEFLLTAAIIGAAAWMASNLTGQKRK